MALRTEAHPDGHSHRAIFNAQGDGWTTSAGGHYHMVRGLVLGPPQGGAAGDNHTHELSTVREEIDELEDVPKVA